MTDADLVMTAIISAWIVGSIVVVLLSNWPRKKP